MRKNLLSINVFSNLLKLATAFSIQLAILLNPLASFASQNSQPVNQPPSPTLLILGDSLSTAFGIEQSQGWVSLLTRKLQNHHYRMQVINASISGETTQGGLQRLPSLLSKHKPVMVIVELGGNDGLRGLKLSMIKSNLRQIIEKIKAENANIVLAGIRLPPNYGQIYTEKFYQIYQDLSKQENVTLVPFFMDGVAKNSAMMQADGIHPTAKAQPVLFNNVWEILRPLLSRYMAQTEKQS
jgi:acyl-CoA thioesterase-1